MRTLLFILAPFLTASLGAAPSDSLLTAVLWEEQTPGERNGYVLRFNEFGPFEEDAGENYRRSARYLMGQWSFDSIRQELTLAVDYFLGQRMVHSRYRAGQDFFIVYKVITSTQDELVLEDLKTKNQRTFRAKPIEDTLDAGERRARKIELGRKEKKGGFKLPKGW